MAAMLLFAAALLLAPADPTMLGLRVVADGSCPTAAAVEAHLQPLLPGDVRIVPGKGRGQGGVEEAEPPPRITAYVEPIDEILRVEVRSESGALLTLHNLQRSAPCPALAAAAAIIIASAAASLPRSAPPESPAKSAAPPPPPAPTKPPPAFLWELGAGGGLFLTNQALTGGGTIELQVAPVAARLSERLHGRLGLRLAAAAGGMRRIALDESIVGAGGVFADYTRLQLTAAPRYRLLADKPLVEAYVGVAGAVVFTEGGGVVRAYRSQALDVGVAGGLRVGRLFQSVALWAELGFAYWLRPQDVALSGQPPSARLPAWDILLLAGFSGGRLRPSLARKTSL
jgi:hypothetical protein